MVVQTRIPGLGGFKLESLDFGCSNLNPWTMGVQTRISEPGLFKTIIPEPGLFKTVIPGLRLFKTIIPEPGVFKTMIPGLGVFKLECLDFFPKFINKNSLSRGV